MENNYDHSQRPALLTILCVVTFLSNLIFLLLNVTDYLNSSKALSELENLANELYEPSWKMPFALSVFLKILKMWAIYQMWMLRRYGFFVYALILIAMDVIIMSSFNAQGFTKAIFFLVIDIIIVALFSVNLKFMK